MLLFLFRTEIFLVQFQRYVNVSAWLMQKGIFTCLKLSWSQWACSCDHKQNCEFLASWFMYLNLVIFLNILTTTMYIYVAKDLVVNTKRCRKLYMIFSSGFAWQERKWGHYCPQYVSKLFDIKAAHAVPFFSCQSSSHYLYYHCHI